MVGLDSSVVLRLLIGEPVELAEVAQAFLDELFELGKKAVISDLVVSEVYFALQYHYQVPKGEALDSLAALFDSGEILASGHADAVLKTKNLASSKPGFVDRLIHAGYVAEVDGMATFEKKSARLAGTRVLR